jgi:hypothetical protein
MLGPHHSDDTLGFEQEAARAIRPVPRPVPPKLAPQ